LDALDARKQYGDENKFVQGVPALLILSELSEMAFKEYLNRILSVHPSVLEMEGKLDLLSSALRRKSTFGLTAVGGTVVNS